jgi:pimeloyl-ACP methyl ester carboxylesterase
MTQADNTVPQQGDYVKANGLNIYYEVHGAGEPLILLHGGTLTTKMWEDHVPTFVQHFQVIVLDSRGHGKTDNPTQEFSYRAMAEDVAAFIETLGLRKPVICGYSDGGQIALEIGMRYPDLTRALVISAAWFKFSESYINWTKNFGIEGPGVVNGEYIERERPELVSMWSEWHAPRSPDYWQTLLRQLSTTWLTPLDYTTEDFRKVIVPTLILVGDRDALVPVEEAVEMFRLIPQAELAIGPSINHSFPWKVELFTQLILDFLLRHRKSTD